MTATHNIGDLNAVLPLYKALSGKDSRDVLSKQGGELGYNIVGELRAIRPDKGAIRAEVLARLRSGRGIKIRQSVIDATDAKAKNGKLKKLTRGEELVRREIAVRESGRGVLAFSAKYPRLIGPGMLAVSRYNQQFSQTIFQPEGDLQRAGFFWSGLSQQSQRAVKGLASPRGSEAIDKAVAKTRENVLQYIRPRVYRSALQAVRAMAK